MNNYICSQCGWFEFMRLEAINVDSETGKMIESVQEGRFKCAGCGTIFAVDDDGRIFLVQGAH